MIENVLDKFKRKSHPSKSERFLERQNKKKKHITTHPTMADYHFVYKDVEGASTQWDDIQRKLGNLPPKPPAFKPPPFAPAPDADSLPKDKAWLDSKNEDELEDLEDDLDDDRFLEEYRF